MPRWLLLWPSRLWRAVLRKTLHDRQAAHRKEIDERAQADNVTKTKTSDGKSPSAERRVLLDARKSHVAANDCRDSQDEATTERAEYTEHEGPNGERLRWAGHMLWRRRKARRTLRHWRHCLRWKRRRAGRRTGDFGHLNDGRDRLPFLRPDRSYLTRGVDRAGLEERAKLVHRDGPARLIIKRRVVVIHLALA